MDGADLVGADFRHTVINEGCSFNNAVVDATTRFDGAKIFRPLARQDAFRFYRVERGVLVRREDEATGQLAGSSPSSQSVPPHVEGPPRFAEAEGVIDADYRRFDGRIFIGVGLREFETKWSTAGENEIHVYSNPPSIEAIAVASGAPEIRDVSAYHFQAADFTSKTRTPRSGETVLLRNRNGFKAAVQIVSVAVGPESENRTRLVASYRILADGDGASNSVGPGSVYLDIGLEHFPSRMTREGFP